MRAAITVENRGTDGVSPASGEAISVRMPDVEKLREARKKYDDRVSAALTPDQSKKWREEGYESALGGGSRAVFASAIAFQGPGGASPKPSSTQRTSGRLPGRGIR